MCLMRAGYRRRTAVLLRSRKGCPARIASAFPGLHRADYHLAVSFTKYRVENRSELLTFLLELCKKI